MELSRRRFLGGVGAVAAGVVLEACAGGKSRHAAGMPPAAFGRAAGQRPDPSRPEGTDRIPQIEHVIVLMMENHSYDNYFGLLGRGDGPETSEINVWMVPFDVAASRNLRLANVWPMHEPNQRSQSGNVDASP